MVNYWRIIVQKWKHFFIMFVLITTFSSVLLDFCEFLKYATTMLIVAYSFSIIFAWDCDRFWPKYFTCEVSELNVTCRGLKKNYDYNYFFNTNIYRSCFYYRPTLTLLCLSLPPYVMCTSLHIVLFINLKYVYWFMSLILSYKSNMSSTCILHTLYKYIHTFIAV